MVSNVGSNSSGINVGKKSTQAPVYNYTESKLYFAKGEVKGKKGLLGSQKIPSRVSPTAFALDLAKDVLVYDNPNIELVKGKRLFDRRTNVTYHIAKDASGKEFVRAFQRIVHPSNNSANIIERTVKNMHVEPNIVKAVKRAIGALQWKSLFKSIR